LVGGAAADVTRARVVAGGVLLVLAASITAWSLAYPQNSLAATLVRALADVAAVTTLGLAVVPVLDTGRYRAELTHRATAPLAVAAGGWLLAELSRLVVTAAQTAAVPVPGLGLRTSADFALSTTAGRSGLFSAAAAALIWLAAVAAPRSAPMVVTAAGLAALGLTARTVAGHLSDSALGAVAVAVHVLAAALWCGMLTALMLTVDHRGQWARVLPRFSQLSLLCVAALLAGGAAGALVMLDAPGQLYTTGYGRVLLAKIVLTVALTVLAWRNRTGWLPAARAHRVSAGVSRTRSLIELAIMAVALTMAAALAVTG
jgi:copper resistance protein D